jgi:hypothetical protein
MPYPLAVYRLWIERAFGDARTCCCELLGEAARLMLGHANHSLPGADAGPNALERYYDASCCMLANARVGAGIAGSRRSQ